MNLFHKTPVPTFLTQTSKHTGNISRQFSPKFTASWSLKSSVEWWTIATHGLSIGRESQNNSWDQGIVCITDSVFTTLYLLYVCIGFILFSAFYLNMMRSECIMNKQHITYKIIGVSNCAVLDGMSHAFGSLSSSMLTATEL